jgi:hypothetical protein
VEQATANHPRRRPDLNLALIVGLVCLASSTWNQAIAAEPGVGGGTFPHPLLIALVYVMFESARCARLLTGLSIGAFVMALTVTPAVVFNYAAGEYHDWIPLAGLAAAAGAGALLGTITALVSLLIRRWTGTKQGMMSPPAAVPPPARLTGMTSTCTVLLVVAAVFESLSWTAQARNHYFLGHWSSSTSVLERNWEAILHLCHFVLLVSVIVAAFAVSRRRQRTGQAIFIYALVGAVVVALRLSFHWQFEHHTFRQSLALSSDWYWLDPRYMTGTLVTAIPLWLTVTGFVSRILTLAVVTAWIIGRGRSGPAAGRDGS